jgi:hypothetical protein
MSGGLEGGDGSGLWVVRCGLGDDGGDGVAGPLFVEGDESPVGVFAGREGLETIEATYGVGVGLDVYIRDGCGAGEFAAWFVAAGDDGTLEVFEFIRGVVAFDLWWSNAIPRFGGGCWRGRGGGYVFGDGRDEAVGVVGDEFGDWFGLCDGAGFGGCAGGLVEDAGDDLQVVEELASALVVEIVGGDAAEELGGDGERGGEIIDDGELEGLVGVEKAELSGGCFGAASGVVEVAELFVAECGRAALVAAGVDVAALVAFLGDGDEIG